MLSQNFILVLAQITPKFQCVKLHIFFKQWSLSMRYNLTLYLGKTVTEFNFSHDENLKFLAELPMCLGFLYIKMLC